MQIICFYDIIAALLYYGGKRMAFIQMSLMSKSLMRTVPVNVILPADKRVFPDMELQEERPFRTLYLLHGILGSNTDWVNGSRIQRYAEEHDLAVVMPSGDNAFYIDQPDGENYYGEYIGEELVELTRRFFPLSKKREDTFIGGLSMGGYGALRNGLKYHETFGSIIALSSALVIEDMPKRTNDVRFYFESRKYAEHYFGDLGLLLKSDKNPKYLIDRLAAEGAAFPGIYMACGDQDSLLPVNQDLAEYLRKKGIPVTFKTGRGAHEWDFWDKYILDAIEWLPPSASSAKGIGSGNVGI